MIIKGLDKLDREGVGAYYFDKSTLFLESIRWQSQRRAGKSGWRVGRMSF